MKVLILVVLISLPFLSYSQSISPDNIFSSTGNLTNKSARISWTLGDITARTYKTKNIINLGSGVEFIGRPFTPLFLEYKYLLYERKTTPFIFIRGGAVVQIGSNDPESSDIYYNYNPFNYGGGMSFAIGSGVSWAKEDYEAYLSFAYRYAHTSYQQYEYNQMIVTYNDYLHRLEIKFGLRF